MEGLKDQGAIVGVGETEYTRDSGRTELSLAVEASKNAIADAGLLPEDIDGMVKFSVGSTSQGELAACLGIPYLRFYGELGPLGGAACGLVLQAVLAVSRGMAKHVLVYRAVNGRSGRRYGSGVVTSRRGEKSSAFTEPYGLLVPAQSSALRIRRHMHEFGTTVEQLGAIAVAFRKHACLNPKAIMYDRPITMEDYFDSKMFFDPLRMFDCALEADGACAFVVTAAANAGNMKQRPVYVMNAGQDLPAERGSFARSWEESGGARMGPELFAGAGVTPQDIDVVGFYDHFSPVIITKLEDYGFCERGEGGPFLENGRIEVGGELPVNTSGGHLSEAYMQGMNHIIEVVRQLRGQSPAQVENAELGLLDSGDGSGALILRR